MRPARVLSALTLLFLVTILMVPGCGGGPAKGSLSGTVVYGEKPVKIGKVLAWGGDGSVREGEIMPDGTYLVKDVVAGQVTLCVLSPNPADTPERKGPDGKAPPGDGTKANRKDWFLIPPEFSEVKTSPLKTTITSGDQKYDIKMTASKK